MTQIAASKADKQPAPLVNAQQVEDYLQQHPDYFSNHLELLEQMHIPHPTGPAISLLSRQVELLRERNQRLHDQLNELIDIARSNDDLSRRMHVLTKALVEAPNLEETLAGLESVMSSCFMADLVSVRILGSSEDSALCGIFIDPGHPELDAFSSIFQTGLPRCSHPTQRQATFLFGQLAEEARSCAFIPIRCGSTNVLLTIGSRDPNHFNPTMGHLFLTQIGELLGSRLDALLNRDPRD